MVAFLSRLFSALVGIAGNGRMVGLSDEAASATGPGSRPWGRNLRRGPPALSLPQIMAGHQHQLIAGHQHLVLAQAWARANPAPPSPDQATRAELGQPWQSDRRGSLPGERVMERSVRSPTLRVRTDLQNAPAERADSAPASQWAGECHPYATAFPEVGVTVGSVMGMEVALEAYRTNNDPNTRSTVEPPGHPRWHCKYCRYYHRVCYCTALYCCRYSADLDGEIISHFHRKHFLPEGLTIGQVSAWAWVAKPTARQRRTVMDGERQWLKCTLSSLCCSHEWLL